MITESEIRKNAERACPYARRYVGYGPWIGGYTHAAEEYEKKLEKLREVIRIFERRGFR